MEKKQEKKRRCRRCQGEGFLSGLEWACPECNPGGEFRNIYDYPSVEGEDLNNATEEENNYEYGFNKKS